MKRNWFTRIVCMLLVAVFCLGLGACDGSTDASDTSPSSAGDASPDGSGSDNDPYAEPMTITWTVTDTHYPGDEPDEYVQAILDKFNITIEYNIVDFTSWEEKVGIMFSANSATDLTYLAISSINFNKITSWARNGQLRAYPSDFSDYPGLKSVYDMMGDGYYDTIRVDGDVYTWLVPRGQVSECTPGGILYRKDWAQDVGLYQDDQTYTRDEFTNLIRTVFEQDPGNVGAGLVGYGDPSWAHGFYLYSLDEHPYWETFNLNAAGDGYEWTYFTDGAKEKFRQLNQLYKDGIYWQDFYSGEDAVLNELIMTGKIFARHCYTFPKTQQDLKDGFQTAFPDKNYLDCYDWAWVTDDDGVVHSVFDELYYACEMISANVDDAKYNRILALMDYMASEEGTNFTSYGIEGQDWHYEDGVVVCDWDTDADGNLICPTVNVNKINVLAAENRKAPYFTGQYDADITKFDYDSQVKKLEMWQDGTFTGVTASQMMPSNFYIGPVKEEYGDLSSVTFPYESQIIVAEDFEATWQSLLDEYGDIALQIQDELNQGVLGQ